MVDRLVSVGDDFTLPASVKATDANLPGRLGATQLSATFLTVLVYDGTAYPPRPSGAPGGLVRYHGPVEPTDMLAGDEWADTSSTSTGDTTAPTAVTGLTAGTATASSIPLSWTAATDETGVTGYEYSTNGTTWASTGSTGTTYTVTGLSASTSYTVQVRAFDAAGNRGPSASVTATTAASSDTTAPTAPTNLAGTAGETTMDLSWTASTDDVGVTGYRVSSDNGATWITSTVTGTTYQVTGLTAGTSYTFAVAARDAAGNWSTNATLTKSTTAAASAPAPGTVLTSDGFTGANVASINGRATDLALGGSALTWAGTGTLGITSNAMAQTAASPTGDHGGTLTLAQTTANIQLDFDLTAKPVGANLDVFLYDGTTVAAIIRFSPSGTHEVMTSGFGGTTFAVTGGVGAVRLIIKGTAMSGYLPANDGTSSNGTATNTAVFQYSKVTFSTGTATGLSIDDVKVSIPV